MTSFCCRSFVCAILSFALTSLTSFADESNPANEAPDISGIWSTHYQQSFLSIIVRRDYTAHVIWIMKGSHQMGETRWRPAENGMIVEGMPRFRFWRMTSENRMKVEMEKLPLEMLGGEWKKFPPTFYMNRQQPFSWPEGTLDRPLPEGWSEPSPPSIFDERAGKPRLANE